MVVSPRPVVPAARLRAARRRASADRFAGGAAEEEAQGAKPVEPPGQHPFAPAPRALRRPMGCSAIGASTQPTGKVTREEERVDRSKLPRHGPRRRTNHDLRCRTGERRGWTTFGDHEDALSAPCKFVSRRVGAWKSKECLLRGDGSVHPTNSPCGRETPPMRKPATGERCAIEPPAWFKGRGLSLPDPCPGVAVRAFGVIPGRRVTATRSNPTRS